MPRSFDLFDTLISRLHYRPDSIFHRVEQAFPFPGFAFHRMAAQGQSDGSLPDIYRHVQKNMGISAEMAEKLMALEFQVELSQIFPIVANLNQVQDGDLIITDTYYSKTQIAQILDHIQCRKKVEIHSLARGKSSGKVWPDLKSRITRHLGDHPHSDVAMPRSFGIESEHYRGNELSKAEQQMVQLDHLELAYLMRALRLQNPYSAPYDALWNDQCQLNVPFLVHASLFLNDFCQKHKKKRVLFTTRDGCLWIQIFQALFPQYESHSFHSSRHVYMHPSPAYIEYVKSLYSEEALIVDCDGEGRTCRHFFRHHIGVKPTHLSIVKVERGLHSVLRYPRVCDAVEKINYDLSGTLYAYQEGPLRCPVEYDVQFVQPSHDCVVKCVELLPRYALGSFDRKVVRWAVKTMEKGLSVDQHISHSLVHFHVGEQHLHFLRNGEMIHKKLQL
ncbi:MAG: hypothetical protein HY069_04195 [Chlamydiia bacterium]|nr:hypothetical protein [Chlamydiia bacterium]